MNKEVEQLKTKSNEEICALITRLNSQLLESRFKMAAGEIEKTHHQNAASAIHLHSRERRNRHSSPPCWRHLARFVGAAFDRECPHSAIRRHAHPASPKGEARAHPPCAVCRFLSARSHRQTHTSARIHLDSGVRPRPLRPPAPHRNPHPIPHPIANPHPTKKRFCIIAES